jgi:purine-nucleoside phosphorylase
MVEVLLSGRTRTGLQLNNMMVNILPDTSDYLKKHGVDSLVGAISTGSGQPMHLATLPIVAEINYNSLPGMNASNIPGQSGVLRIVRGTEGNWAIWVGRRHYYQGYRSAEISMYLDISASLGAKYLLCVNAAGGLNSGYMVGDIVVIDKYKSFIPDDKGSAPLDGGPWRINSPLLYTLLYHASSESDVRVHTGNYIGVPGPTYETEAEVGWLRSFGGDVVGMSTTPELDHANSLGTEMAALSLVANVHGGTKALSHKDVVESSLKSAGQLDLLVEKFLS